MIKIHRKFGNFFIVENDTAIAMCTQSAIANRVRAALNAMECKPETAGRTLAGVAPTTAAATPLPPENRDCDACTNDGECYVTMLKCKGFKKVQGFLKAVTAGECDKRWLQ